MRFATRTIAACLGLTTLAVGVQPSLFACLHVPEEYESSFEAQSQQSIVYHDGKKEVLIVKMEDPASGSGASSSRPYPPGFRGGRVMGIMPRSRPRPPTSGGGSGTMSMATIIPVPVAVDGVKLDVLKLIAGAANEEANAKLANSVFKELKETVDLHSRPRTRGLRGGISFGGADGGRDFQEERFGPYGITRFDNSAAGQKALNEWIVARAVETAQGRIETSAIKALNFNLPAFQYYLRGKWTFCAIRVADLHQALAPVRIEFTSKNFFFPIKLTAAGTESSLDREGSYTVYALTKAGHNMTAIQEDMAMHKLDQAAGELTANGQAPLVLDDGITSGNLALERFIKNLSANPGDLQVLRFSGSFNGREAVRFAGDVSVEMK